MPLAMLFRDAGAAMVTVIHRSSYRELFADVTCSRVGLGGLSREGWGPLGSAEGVESRRREAACRCCRRCHLAPAGLAATAACPARLLPSTQRAEARAQADACLPRVPGTLAGHAHGAAGEGSALEQEQHQQVQQQQEQVAQVQQAQQQQEQQQVAQEQQAKQWQQRHAWQPPPAEHPYAISYSSKLRQAYGQQGVAEEAHTAPTRGPRSAAGPLGQGQAAPGGASGTAGSLQVADLPGMTATADVLVVAVGYPHLVKRHWVKPGAVVVDVGINVVEEDWEEQQNSVGGSAARRRRAAATRNQHQNHHHGAAQHQHHPFHVVGDVDAEDVAGVASVLTPVPGGVGPMTIAAVLHNTLAAARRSLLSESW